MMTLVASALAGGDCIDDADVLHTGGTCPASTIFAGPVASFRNVAETLAPGVPPDQR